MTSKLYLCSFASSNLLITRNRFEFQAKKMNVYDHIYLYDETNLNSKYLNRFSKLFKLRGFGYFSWKPEIILQTLSKINDGDILQYTDMGCHLNYKGINRLKEYVAKTSVSENGLLVFQDKSQLEYQWTKSSVFHFFSVESDDLITKSNQIIATVFFIKKCSESIKIIEHWSSLAYSNFELFEDSNCQVSEIKEFKEHRYDQSVFSLLSKIYGVTKLSSDEVWQQDWKNLANFPIHAKRDKEFMNKFSLKKIAKAYLPYFVINIYLSIMYRILKN